MSLLEIETLSMRIGTAEILNGVDMTVDPGEVMALVGESGSGKSLTALSVLRLLPQGAHLSGRISFDGVDVLGATDTTMNGIRGAGIGMVFQEPMTALNPVQTIGRQVAEGMRWHLGGSRTAAERDARRMLARVGLAEAQVPASRYPHELSGGQRQRVVIAIACALNPKLLIADEPTTALDVVAQAQALALLRGLVQEREMALLLISHDLAVVAEMADRITILRDGRVIEAGATARVLSSPANPYTRKLAQASMHVPARAARTETREPGAPLLQVEGVSREYSGRRLSIFGRSAAIRAVDDVSFTMAAGQSIALLGRSGCGKSTLARIVLALDAPTGGTVRFLGETLTGRPDASLKAARRDLQAVFQDPYSSFNPRHTVERLVAEPLHLLGTPLTGSERRDRVEAALRDVGLEGNDMRKFPHQFSGGQRQRLSIARAIITRPKLIVADEPVSALDVSIRAQILDLFADLNERLGVAYLFITHDLTVARAISDEILVMHEGRIVERGRTADILSNPKSDPARALVEASPDLTRALAKRLDAVR